MKRTLALSSLVAVIAVRDRHAGRPRGAGVCRDSQSREERTATGPTRRSSRIRRLLLRDGAGTGGAHGAGTVFRVDGNNNFVVLHDFTDVDGSQPQGRLVARTGRCISTERRAPAARTTAE